MIFNFGSINVDHVYRVARFAQPGETLVAKSYEKFLGGKGINQSIAAFSAGGAVRHIGAVGADGGAIVSEIRDIGLDVSGIATSDQPTGNAVIQVDDNGENLIIIVNGANHALTDSQIDGALGSATPGDWVLLQNETNLVAEIASRAKSRGLKVAYSAAPYDAEAVAQVIDVVDLLAVNEGEAQLLVDKCGKKLQSLGPQYVVVTYGEKGARIFTKKEEFFQPAYKVSAVDTTGAGDTFIGSLLGRFDEMGDLANALRYAAAASALQVTKPGAAMAIPANDDVVALLEDE